MSGLFLKILNMSISASWLILAVLIARLALKKAPKWIRVLLWGIVAVRLICPFSIESPISLIPESAGHGEFVSEWADDYIGEVSIIHDHSKYYDAAVAVGREPVYDGNGYYVVTRYDQLGEPPTIENTVLPVLTAIWVIGVVLLFFYTIASYLRLRQRVSTAILLQGKIYQSENVNSPFVLGVIRPKIYLPFDMDEQDIEHVIAHEQAHIHRKDHWWKPLGFLLLTIYWFHPLIWLSYVLLCRDIELACDEKVIKRLSNELRADYMQALVSCSVNRRIIAACPLAFGEVSVKERVKAVMNYRKPSFWIVVLAVMICAAVAGCFLTNPVKANSDDQNEEQPEAYADAGLPHDADAGLPHDADDAQQPDKGGESNAVLDQASYYLELASAGKDFQDMDEEQCAGILGEYGTLLDEYTLFARESTDNSVSYILGYYDGNIEDSPFHSLYSMEFSLPMEDTWQLLHQESDAEAIERSLADGEMPDAGYVIKNSYVYYAAGSRLIMIEPRNMKSSLTATFQKYLSPDGPAYIADAVSRGIVLDAPDEPYLTVYLISENYGEISETIPLSEKEAAAILAEERQMPDFGLGFFASLCVDGESVYFTERTGIPQSVLTMATEKCGYQFASPKDIEGTILEARLDCDWLETPLYADESDLERLREILVNAEFDSVGGCGYGAKLTVTLSNGEKITAFKGCDSCDSMVFGSYGGYSIGDSENTEFWEIFGLDEQTKELLK